MVTNRDIEIAFVRAQNRINENLQRAQIQFMAPELEMVTQMMLPIMKGKPSKAEPTNPLTNEEI